MSAQTEVTRPWGSYITLEEASTHKVKRIVVQPGKRLSYQRHQHRAEHWFIVQGKGVLTLDGVDTEVSVQSSISFDEGQLHRIENTGYEELVFIEVQTGTYFGEDDIERLEDDFGRAGA